MSLKQLNTEYLLFVWNRFWFSNELEPSIVDCPPEYSENEWIGSVYNELIDREIWPILEIQGWHDEVMKQIRESRKKRELLEQQREGLG